jgi:hypothetical protein
LPGGGSFSECADIRQGALAFSPLLQRFLGGVTRSNNDMVAHSYKSGA